MTSFEKKYLELAKRITLEIIPPEEYAVFLFGSRAEGIASKKADIDIGIWGMKPFPSAKKSELEYKLMESHIPYHVDVIDFSGVSTNFKSEALKHIILWNQPKDFSLSSMN